MWWKRLGNRTRGNLPANASFTSPIVASSSVPGTSIVTGRPRARVGVRPAGETLTCTMDETETMVVADELEDQQGCTHRNSPPFRGRSPTLPFSDGTQPLRCCFCVRSLARYRLDRRSVELLSQVCVCGFASHQFCAQCFPVGSFATAPAGITPVDLDYDAYIPDNVDPKKGPLVILHGLLYVSF